MDRSEVCDRFLDALEFELYPFQEEALLAWFESPGGILVSAPTGMGKTLIAEAAIFEALHTGQCLYYTTPLIALTDQKFREFQDKAEAWGFSRDDVGLITGNRRTNPNARIRVVVAEILLNHLLAGDEQLSQVSGVVMDEFHSFNDRERGIVWELTLVLLPEHIRMMLLSATVGNAADFARWLKAKHGRSLQLVQTTDRRVPLEFNWISDKQITEYLPEMVSDDDGKNRTPALVFCFVRDVCWEVAERLKGLKIIDQARRAQIAELLDREDFSEGAGPKIKQLLIRGVGVHHAGVLPRHKLVVESLFLKKLIPFVVCTETLAAGINLPARSVVFTALVKGKRGDKKMIPASVAHQMFGRAGRPQFDSKGYVYAFAHEDDVKIEKWKAKYQQLDTKSKDPGIMRARKTLERKRPSRRKTQTYWTQGQFQTLIEAGPAKLYSQSMIPYQVLVYLLTRTGTLHETMAFLDNRFNTEERIAGFHKQLDHMIANLATFGYLVRSDDGDHVTLDDSVEALLTFRSVDPMYGAFLAGHLARASFVEKLLVLESVLPVAPAIARRLAVPELDPGPLETQVARPEMLRRGLAIVDEESADFVAADDEGDGADYWEDQRKPALRLPEMLKMLFDARLATPEELMIQTKWLAGAILDLEGDFYKFVRSRDFIKDEGIILRHLLRLVILAGEFFAFSGEDPDYSDIAAKVTGICSVVDRNFTDRFLTVQSEATPIGKL